MLLSGDDFCVDEILLFLSIARFQRNMTIFAAVLFSDLQVLLGSLRDLLPSAFGRERVCALLGVRGSGGGLACCGCWACAGGCAGRGGSALVPGCWRWRCRWRGRRGLAGSIWACRRRLRCGQGLVRLADCVTGGSAPAPTVPVQQSGTAAGGKHLVPASVTRGLKHATGHAPGKGKGQLPAWTARTASTVSASGTFTSGSAVKRVRPGDQHAVQSGTTAQSDLYKNADGSYTRKVWPGTGELPDLVGLVGADRRDAWRGIRGPLAGEGELGRPRVSPRQERPGAGDADGGRGASRYRSRWPGRSQRDGRGERVVGDLPGHPAGNGRDGDGDRDGISESLTLHSAQAGDVVGVPAEADGADRRRWTGIRST